MNYLVMECHPGYAIVLDQEGRFLKVANQHFEVGQSVDHVIELNVPTPQSVSTKGRSSFIKTLSAMAACLCICFIGLWYYLLTPYGSVRMQINPDVQINVNRFDRVIGLKGLNDDGNTLIEDYSYRFKQLKVVTEELSDLAVEMNYLTDGGQIHLTVTSDHKEWLEATKTYLLLDLEVYTGPNIHIYDNDVQPYNKQQQGESEIVVPIYPNSDDDQDDDILLDDDDDDVDDNDNSKKIIIKKTISDDDDDDVDINNNPVSDDDDININQEDGDDDDDANEEIE